MNVNPYVLLSSRLHQSLLVACLVLLLLAFTPRHTRAAGSTPDEGSLDGISILELWNRFLNN